MLMNVMLNTVMVAVFDWGAASVAFATSLSAWLNFAWLWKALANKSPQSHLFTSLGKVALASVMATLAVLLFEHFFWGKSTAFAILQGEIPSYPITLGGQMLHFATVSVVFLLVLGVIAWIIKAKDLTHFAVQIKENA